MFENDALESPCYRRNVRFDFHQPSSLSLISLFLQCILETEQMVLLQNHQALRQNPIHYLHFVESHQSRITIYSIRFPLSHLIINWLLLLPVQFFQLRCIHLFYCHKCCRGCLFLFLIIHRRLNAQNRCHELNLNKEFLFHFQDHPTQRKKQLSITENISAKYI